MKTFEFIMETWDDDINEIVDKKFTECVFKTSNYMNNNALYVEVFDFNEGPLCTVSINLYDSFFLKDDEFYVKDYDGMPKIVKGLEDLGFIENLKEKTQQGMGTYTKYKLLPKAKEYIYKEE